MTARDPLERRVAEERAAGEPVAARAEAERQATTELDAWRARAVPDAAAPLAAEDVARLVPDCLAALGVDPTVGAGFSVNTVHYYRRRDILDAPAGRTSAARYGLRHIWQAAGARLAGHLGLVTLAEARTVMRGADAPALLGFVAARVADARARQVVRGPALGRGWEPRPLPGAPARSLRRANDEVPSSPSIASEPLRALVIRLPEDAWCVIPASHVAHQSADAARALVRALAAALHVSPGPEAGSDTDLR